MQLLGKSVEKSYIVLENIKQMNNEHKKRINFREKSLTSKGKKIKKRGKIFLPCMLIVKKDNNNVLNNLACAKIYYLKLIMWVATL